MKSISFVYLFFFMIFMISTELLSDSGFELDHYEDIMNYVKQNDISHFENKWNLSDEKDKQCIIKQQKETFSFLFSKFMTKSYYQPEMFTLLVKLSRLTPISSPYERKLLNFIMAQDKELMPKYFNILSSYLPKLSASQIKYLITEENQTYTVYNIDILKCFFISELIKLQIENNKPSEQILLLERLLDFYRQLKLLGIDICDTTLSMDKNNIEVIIYLKKPTAKIMLTKDRISVDINNRPELEAEK